MSQTQSQALPPLQLLMLVVVLTGAVVGLNKVSPLIAPGILALSLVGIIVIATRHRLEARREAGKAHLVDHSRLNQLQLKRFLPWLKENIRGQDAVIDVVYSDLERGLRLAKPGRPIGAFLLVGPTGTGKTFLATLIGQALFPESKPVVIRMNQYKHADDVYTLLGPPPGVPGFEVGGTLTRPLLENPYRVVIFDEIEKSHRDVQHCLYDVLDAGSCREKSSGKLVDFSGTVFFATCNAGVPGLRQVREKSRDTATWLGQSRDVLADQGGFDKAFLARWTGIYLMDELSPMHVAEVACLQLAAHWKEYGLEVAHASPEVILSAVEGNETFKEYGVRQLGAYLQDVTKDAIIRARDEGAKRVWLGVAPDRTLSISKAE
ncbi:MAG: AAA family ATPase [Gemmatimonadota bacterium]|nr:AAA family ATPase [Gemmatimonadota bacterium]MDH4347187.1 AAA family ATPase [Gemmatimonadota bacterium]MDH5284238.1 AAA family ATPase [Gemmatimonadota bacterium]